MADERIDIETVLGFATENSDNVVKVLTEIQTLVGDLANAGLGAERTLKTAFKNLGKALDTVRSGTDSAKKSMQDFGSVADKTARESVAGFDDLTDKVKEATYRLKDLAEAHVVGGGLEPQRVAIKDMSFKEAREIVAVQEAQGVTAGRTARKIVDAEKRIVDAKKEAINLSREKRRADMSEVEALRDKIEVLKEEQSSLQGKLGASVRWGDKEGEATSRENLNRVNRDLHKSEQDLAAATQKATEEFEAQSASLPTLRYAMYDISRTATLVTGAITAAGAATVVASAKYESAFTSVERTSGVTGDAVNTLRGQFRMMTREIPQAFDEITSIGARGAQLGVATEQLEGFTKVVAQFVATSDTVTLEESVEAFGRISNLLGDTNFSRIGSAITLVGVNAAATEAQIVKTTQELAPFATAVGMSADETIGLAAALGSLGQPPERARSAFLTLQRVMDTAISSGSDNLQVFAQMLNLTVDEVSSLWKQDPGEFIQAFTRSLASVDDLTGAFKALGINERRAVQVFQALASDARNSAGELSVLERAMADSAKGYAENTEMARQYALILDDLSSKWQLLVNAFGELAATVGDVWAPAVKVALDVLTKMVHGLTTLANTDSGKAIIILAGALGAVTVVLGTIVAGMTSAIAATFALKTVMDGLGTSVAREAITFRALNTQVTQFVATVRGGTAALRTFKAALIATGVGVAVTAFGAIAEAVSGSGETVEDTFNRYISSTEGLLEALQADLAGYQEALSAGNQDLANSFTVFTNALTEATTEGEGYTDAVKAAADMLGYALPQIEAVNSALEGQTVIVGESATAWLNQALVASDEFQKLSANPEFVESWKRMAIDFDEVLRIAAESGVEGVEAYFMSQASQFADGANALLSGFRLFVFRVWQSMKAGFQTLKTLYWENIKNLFSGGEVVSFGDAIFDLADDFTNIWNTPVLKKGFSDVARTVAGLGSSLRETGKAAKVFGEELDADGLDEFGNSAGGPGGAGSKVDDLAKKLRTVTDYAKDLSDVFGRSFQLRFGIEQVQDTTTKILNNMRKAAEQAAEKIRELRQTIRSLNAEIGVMESDLAKQKYFLSIAVEYGDTARQEAISSRIGKLEEDIAKKKSDRLKKEKELAFEIENSSKTLVGNSEVALKNRDEILKLVKTYEDQIKVLAESGASQAEVRRQVGVLRSEFEKQATALGFSSDEIKKYSASFNDMAKIVDRVPRDVTLEIKGLDVADAALREFFAKLEKDAKTAGDRAGSALGGGVGGGIPASIDKSKDDVKNKMFKFAGLLGRDFNLGFGPVVDPVKTLLDKLKTGEPLTLTQSKFLADSMALETNKVLREKYDPNGELLKALKAGEPLTIKQSGALSNIIGSTVNTGLRAFLTNNLPKTLQTGVNAGKAGATSAGAIVGRETGSKIGSATGSNLLMAQKIPAGINNASVRSAVSIASSSISATIAGSLFSGIGVNLNRLLGVGSKARNLMKSVTGFSGGGFTGRGGKYEVAGAVHRGEYVFPKREVDQSTGLPTTDALGRMLARQSAPVRAGSGSAGGFGSIGAVALTAGTIQQIANAVRPHLYLDGDQVASATATAYANNTKIGAF